VPDEEGRELPDLEVARAEALKGVRGILAEDVLQGQLNLKGRLELLDEAGALLFTLPFAETVVILAEAAKPAAAR
jgi:hypothetical protein